MGIPKNPDGLLAQTNGLCYKRASCVSPKINLTFHPNYRIILYYQLLNRQALFGGANMNHIQTVKIHDVEDGEIYTAKIQKNGKRWIGWIQEHPKVKCEANTQDALLETLENTLYQTLEADWQAWDKQLEDDVKTGKLDSTLERVSKDFHAGKCEDLAVFLSQNATEK